jgi:hypothetical protein
MKLQSPDVLGIDSWMQLFVDSFPRWLPFLQSRVLLFQGT